MTGQHPDLDDEQAYIDHAYDCLERSRADAWKLRDLHDGTLGGTFQARYERDVFDEAVVNRLTKLDLGDAALVFGRIDRLVETAPSGELPHRPSGRRRREQRAGGRRLAGPVAEPFYRATGREPMGLARRRHFAVHGRTLLGIEDELFGDGHLGVGARRGPRPGRPRHRTGARRRRVQRPQPACAATARCSPRSNVAAPASSATSSPPSRASRTRSSAAPRPACWSCRAGPAPARRWSPCTVRRTCCTRSASRSKTRACWSSAPTGCSCATSSACCRRSARPASSRWCSAIWCPTSTWCATAIDPADSPLAARVKGDLRMAEVIDQAVTDRERPLREDVVVPFRTGYLRLRARSSARIVRAAQRRFRRHNAARRWVEGEVWAAMANSWRDARRDARRGPRRGPLRCPRSAPRSSGCGRCSRRPAAARPVRLEGAAASWPARKHLTEDEYLVALPAAQPPTSPRSAGPTPTSPCSTRPAACLGPRPVKGKVDESGRDPHLRPHRHRRGAGPHADAAADGRRADR